VGVITRVAGTMGVAGSGGDDGPATDAQLNGPSGVAVTADGGFLIADSLNHVVRKVLWVGLFDAEKGKDFTLVYRDGARNAYGKRVHIESFIHDKEYRLFKDEKGKLDLLLEGDAPPGKLHLQFVAQKRQRQKEAEFDLGELEFAGTNARGQKLAPKPVARVKQVLPD